MNREALKAAIVAVKEWPRHVACSHFFYTDDREWGYSQVPTEKPEDGVFE